MALFTMLLEFKGGTYISQLRAPSARSAVKKWAAQQIKTGTIYTPAIRKKLAAALAAENLVRIDMIQSVWCATASVGSLALINVIQTTGI